MAWRGGAELARQARADACGARRGDMIVWRSNLVPHATGLPWIPGAASGSADDSEEGDGGAIVEVAERRRSSLTCAAVHSG